MKRGKAMAFPFELLRILSDYTGRDSASPSQWQLTGTGRLRSTAFCALFFARSARPDDLRLIERRQVAAMKKSFFPSSNSKFFI
jgi:hypothetical protein